MPSWYRLEQNQTPWLSTRCVWTGWFRFDKPEWKGVEILVVWTYVATEKEEPSNVDAEAAIRGKYGL
jgi:hypothetical protein